MAKEVTLPFEVSYKGQDGVMKTRKFNLSLAIGSCLAEGEEDPGDVTINVVMPVGSTDPGTTGTTTGGESIQPEEAIAA